jgi:hypothetical protein
MVVLARLTGGPVDGDRVRGAVATALTERGLEKIA